MSLYRRSGGTYDSYLYVDGVRYRRATNTKNRRLAENIERKFEEDLLRQRHGITEFKPEMTFGELVAKFCGSECFKSWHNERLKLLLPYFEKHPIQSINKKMLREYRSYRHKAKTLTESTINRDLQCLRRVLNWAVEESFIADNPIRGLHLEPERRKKKPVLSLQEQDLLLPHCAPHLRQIVIAALQTGMRRGELLQQRWEDIYFEISLLYVTRSKTATGEGRPIPLSEELKQLLLPMRKPEGLVFTLNDKPIHRIKTAWKAAIRRSEIRYLRFHYLRHTFNTRLMEASVMREVRMALLGHTFSDTHTHYEHVELPMLRDAIRKLEVWTAAERSKLQAQNDTHEQKGEQEHAKDSAA